MVKTNIQTFTGDVEVLEEFHVGSNLVANDTASNVLTVIGSIGANTFIGDGGLLSNIATTLGKIVDQGNAVANVVRFSSNAEITSFRGTGLVTDSNVGIQNTYPLHTLSIGDKVYFDDTTNEALGQSVMVVDGRINATRFEGDGGLLSNIATTLGKIVDQGNTVSNVVIFNSNVDITEYGGVGFVTTSNVGIQNTDPTHTMSIGSKLFVDIEGSNVLTVQGNAAVSNLLVTEFTVSPAHNLQHVTQSGSASDQTIQLTNATTGLVVSSNATVGGNVTAESVISTANVEVGNRLKFSGSNVFVDTLRVADVAANIVTYDRTTGELLDSSGTFMNKFAVVSEQPPSNFFANATTVANHGTYTLTTSNLATDSNTFNAFDGTANAWVSGDGYIGGSNVFHETNLTQLSNLHPTQFGDWLAIEFPYKTTLRHMKLTPLTAAQFPASANLYATNNDLTWSEVKYWKDVNPVTSSNVQTIVVNATEQFKKYALVATKAAGNSANVAIQDWQLFTESFSIDGGKVAMASSAVMGGETTVEQSGPHSRLPKATPLRKYPEIVFEEGKFDANDSTNTYVQAGYMVSSNGYYDNGPTDLRQPWRAFNNVLLGGSSSTDIWLTPPGSFDNTNSPSLAVNGDSFTVDSTTYTGHWIKLELPTKIKASKIRIYSRGSDQTKRRPYKGVFLGSNTGNTNDWSVIKSFDGDLSWTTVGIDTANREIVIADLNSTTNSYFKYVMFVIQSTVGTGQFCWINELEYYGYEELATQGDTSVDTTFTSIMNTPQTTGANVYVDGNLGETFTNRVTGPTPTGTATTYNSTDKYWELTGALTSNISVEANTFLEGDAPHSVSVWFNSSNLEANTANTCVFSISDQEKLDSVNLDLQSNTWHNLTYAYQGEGGSRVTYLDGRKVAEDQAEDTFGEYPPFAMTGYSQGGYVVSASGEYSSTYQQWEPYGEGGTDAPNSWISGPTQNYFGTGTGATGEAYTSGANVADTTVIDGVTTYGEWNQVEFPEKLHLSSVALNGINTIDTARYPRDAIVCASIDGITWTSIGSWTGEVNRAEADIKHYILNSTKAFKYVRIVVTKISTGYDGLTMLSRVRYYGHRENDLVRLPDPTNVLKYPHIAMTGPAQRGYVASASSNFDTYNPWEAFDNNTGGGWISVGGTNYSGGDGAYNKSPGSLLGTNSVTGTEIRDGEFLQIETPHKIAVNHILISSGSGDGPTDFKFWGSNDSSAWSLLHTETNHTNGTSAQVDINSSVAYKYHAIVISKTRRTTQGDYVNVRELELYGTEENSSIPIQIGGGNIDKVANFRVYDKFVGEDQALEIWDAQKDTFRGVKNSVTLHKGRLGIGTTEPQGRLAVADEPHNLEEFPPRAMTGYKNYFEGHGEFCVSASSELSDTYNIQNVFNKITTIGDSSQAWISGGSPDTFVTSTGLATAENSFEGVNGPWIKLELPYNVKPKKVQMFMRTTSESNSSRRPKSGIVYGRKDGMYHQITNFDFGSTDKDIPLEELNLNTRDYYSEFVLQITSMYLTGASTDAIAIKGINFFGTREQGQSVLHDGELTLTKSLNVPRIGPALDADDTPRRDRLVVEYNTSTNPTFEGAVRDTSGRGNDGVFYGGAYYDATEKSLEVPGARGIIRKNINLPGGNIPLSVSAWFRGYELTTTNNDTIVCLGTNSTATGGGSFILRVNTDQLRINFEQSSNYTEFSTTIANGIWYHVVATYDGGTSASGRKLFIDGVEIAQTSTDGTITGVNLPVNPDFAVGMRTDISGYINGSISNFKLYDTVLTAEEVKTLYDMGRCDEGHHVVNFSKTRVGIGLGDGEAPRGALDVRGNAFFSGIVSSGMPAIFGAVNNANYVQQSDISQNIGTVQFSQGPNMKRAAGGITLPIAGMYIIQLRTHCWYSGGGVEVVDQHSFERYTASGTIYNSLNRGTILDVQTGGTSGNSDMHHVSTIFIHANAGDYVIMRHGTTPTTTRNYNNEWNYISAACVCLDEPQFSS